MLERYAYVKPFESEGSTLPEQVRGLLLANGKPKTCAHVFAVAEMARELTKRFGGNAEDAVCAALLHDISAVIRPEDMLAYMEAQGAYLDEAEKAHPFLLHQRISRLIAAEDFAIRNEAILSAIEVHTTLRVGYFKLDLIVYLADKLAWDQEGEPPYLAEVRKALDESLEHGVLAHMDYVMDHGMILQPHRWLIEAREALRNRIAGRNNSMEEAT